VPDVASSPWSIAWLARLLPMGRALSGSCAISSAFLPHIRKADISALHRPDIITFHLRRAQVLLHLMLSVRYTTLVDVPGFVSSLVSGHIRTSPKGAQSLLEKQEGTEHKGIKNVKVADLDGVANFRFVYEDGKQSRHWLLMPAGSRLHIGQGPAMRRKGYNPYTFVRHNANSSLFVAVHEFWSEESRIASVEPLHIVTGDPMDAGVQINLADGTRESGARPGSVAGLRMHGSHLTAHSGVYSAWA